MNKGIFIPIEFFEIEELNNTERMVLAIYKYYTEEGKYKCCSLSNEEISDILKMSRRGMIKIKNHLRELGLIRIGTGKTVYYVGTEKVNYSSLQKVNQSSLQKVNYSSPQRCTTVHSKGEPEFTPKVNCSSLINVKKNNKEEKRIKKEKMTQENRITQAVKMLPVEYKKKEMIEWLVSKNKPWIDEMNNLPDDETPSIEQLSMSIKYMIQRSNKFDIYPTKNKPVTDNDKKKDYIDFFDM